VSLSDDLRSLCCVVLNGIMLSVVMLSALLSDIMLSVMLSVAF
jgi:hypothetical protein